MRYGITLAGINALLKELSEALKSLLKGLNYFLTVNYFRTQQVLLLLLQFIFYSENHVSAFKVIDK